MRDLDLLTSVLREQADGIRPLPLLERVQQRARRLRRRRQMTAVTTVFAVVVGVVGGTALVNRDHDSTVSAPQPSASPAVSSPAVAASTPPGLPGLVGRRWYVIGWNIGLKDSVPATAQPPVLTFTGLPADGGHATASAFDGAGNLSWPVEVQRDTMSFGAATASGPPADSAAADVRAALRDVLSGFVGWQLVAGQLTFDGPRGDRLTLVSMPPPSAQSPVRVLLGKTWYLTSVTRLGRTWTPDVTSTLVFRTTATALTDDSENTEQWRVALSADTIAWTPGELSTVGGTVAANQVSTAVEDVLVGTTPWRVSGTTLVFSGANGATLTYSTTRPPPPAALGTLKVVLVAAHGAGLVISGKGPVAGIITVADPDGATLWTAPSPVSQGELPVPAGRYSASATIADGTCTPGSIEVPSGALVTLTLSCQDRRSTD